MDITTMKVVSFNAHAINDDTNFKAGIPLEVSPLADVDIESVERAGNSPSYASKHLHGKMWSIRIEVLSAGDIADLMEWFNPYDGVKHPLIVKDVDNGNKLWYVNAVTENMPLFKVNYAIVRLYADDPIWRSVAEVSVNWDITSSGDALVVTNSGNMDAYLKVDARPRGLKTGAYYKHRFPVRAYHVNNAQLQNRAIMVPINTAALVHDTTVSNQINQGGGITAVALTIPIDTAVGGGLAITGGICNCGTEQIKYSGIAAGVMTVVAGGRGWAGTTAAVHADNAVIAQSRCRADGNDIRLYNGGTELDTWLNDMNTTGTEVWSEGLNFDPGLTGALEGTIAATGNVTSITLKNTLASNDFLAKLSATGGLIEVVTGVTPEVFVYSTRDLVSRTITILSRQARGTSMALHSDGDTIRCRQFDLWIYCGYQDATAPEVDATKKPACDLSSSNATLTFNEFGNMAGTRPFSWALSRLASTTKKSKFYTGNQKAMADPITDLGLLLLTLKKGAVWKPEEGAVVARFYDPGGITSVNGAGEKRRVSADWPEIAAIQKSPDGSNWENVYSIVTPTAASAWQAWSSGTVALGAGYETVQLILDGSLRGKIANNEAALEGDSMVIVLTNPVLVTLGTREDMYNLDAAISVQEIGESLGLKWPMIIDEYLYVDSVARTIVHQDGTNAYRAKSLNTKRIPWLRIPPGIYTLVWTEAGVTDVDAVVHYEERNL